jgi:phosphoribosylglycinamide formyltransferase-1
MKSIVLLASGSGTLAEAIFKAVNEKVLDCTVSALICDRVDAPVVQRAHNYQVPVLLHPMISDRQQWNRDLSAHLSSLHPDQDHVVLERG